MPEEFQPYHYAPAYERKGSLVFWGSGLAVFGLAVLIAEMIGGTMSAGLPVLSIMAGIAFVCVGFLRGEMAKS